MSEARLTIAIELLNSTDPRVLRQIGHDQRKRLADTLRLWAWAADEADELARNPPRRSGVLAKLAKGERAP